METRKQRIERKRKLERIERLLEIPEMMRIDSNVRKSRSNQSYDMVQRRVPYEYNRTSTIDHSNDDENVEEDSEYFNGN